MKNLMTVVALLFLAQVGFSQSHWGIKVGFNSTTLAEDSYDFKNVPKYDELKIKLEDTNYRMHFGLLYHFEIGKKLFVQPEFLISSSKYTYKINDGTQTEFIDKILDEKFTYLDIPVQIGLRVHSFQFGIGVVPQLLLSTVSDIASLEDIESKGDDILSLAYTAGVGVDILKTIKLELRYENSDELLGREIIIEDEKYSFDSRTSQWLISATLIF